MKKNLFAFLMMALVISASASPCFANGDANGPEGYAEAQARIDAMSKPVVSDQKYPQWGLQTHSWITGIGSQTIAHTQVIDMASGTVIKELEIPCGYTDPIYNETGNN